MGKRKPRAARKLSGATEQYRVFISHATHDKWIAEILCEKIEATSHGITTFRDDRDIDGGESIPERIKEEIRGCDEFVVLLTPESLQRQWVIVEIGMAVIIDRLVVPLMYHVGGGEIPEIIRDQKGYHLNELDRYLAGLKGRREK
jgi:hypothetical protein